MRDLILASDWLRYLILTPDWLFRTNMEDLIDTTHSRHYELYRKDRLKMMGFEVDGLLNMLESY